MRGESYPAYRQRRPTVFTYALLAGLLVLPALALPHLPEKLDRRVVLGYVLVISVTTFLFYRHDKRNAAAGLRRIPESTLHLAEFMGGWPGAFLAQRLLRHKVVKTPYQVKFWLIVSLHEYAALEFLQEWRWTRGALASVTLYLTRLGG